MQCYVVRGDGDNQGEDIINELCTSHTAGREKGREYLNDHGFDKTTYTITAPFIDMPLSGEVADVLDTSLGERFKAKIVSWSIAVSQPSKDEALTVRTTIDIERFKI